MSHPVKIKLLSPLSHGSFGASTGNAQQIRRTRLVGSEGMPSIPCLSGNALRGVMRRTVMRDLFARLEVSKATLKDKQWDRLYAALANGGTLSGGEKGVDPGALRELRAALPPLSLFGASLYTYMLPGHMSVGICWPVCKETVAAGVVTNGDDCDLVAAEELVEELSLVRHVDREEQDTEATGVTPMPVTFEALAAGASLESRLVFAPHSSEIEIGVAAYALDSIQALGAKSGTGHGRVSISHDLDAGPYLRWLETATSAPLLELAAKL